MDDEEFKRKAIPHLVALEAMVTALARQQEQPAFQQAVNRALSEATAGLDGPLAWQAGSHVRKWMGGEE